MSVMMWATRVWWAAAIVSATVIKSTPGPTFSDDIRPILVEKCAPCHSEHGHGPFNLQTYEQTKRRGDLVRLVSLTGQMPPTDAQSDFGSLTPHMRLTSKELRLIQDWYRLGMPEGKKMPPIAAPKRLTLGKAQNSETLSVGKGQVIPAEGRTAVVTYPLNSLTGKFRSISGFSFQPDAPQAVKQAVLAVQRRGEPTPFTSTGLRPGVNFACWSEGFNPWKLQEATIVLQKEDRLWIRIVSVPTGKPEPASGLIQITHESGPAVIQSKTLGNRSFVIQPEELVVLQSEWKLDHDIDLISILPEARFVTDQLRIVARDETGERNVFMVHTWDATWPGAYNFLKPVRLKKGTTLAYEASITNSKHGHAAVDEKSTILRFGPTANDELFWCHLNYIPR